MVGSRGHAGGGHCALGGWGSPPEEATCDLRSEKLTTQRFGGDAFPTRAAAGMKAFLPACHRAESEDGQWARGLGWLWSGGDLV